MKAMSETTKKLLKKATKPAPPILGSNSPPIGIHNKVLINILSVREDHSQRKIK